MSSSLRDRAADLLQQGFSASATARALGITNQSLTNWARRYPDFGEVYRGRSNKHRAINPGPKPDLGDRTAALCPRAIAVLEQIISNPASRDSDRIRATNSLLAWRKAIKSGKL